jgi:electron transport complex protein RnfG
MKNAFKLPLILAAYTVTACVALALVNNVTSPLIERAKANEANAALKIVFADASSFDDVTGKLESGSQSIRFDKAFVAKKGDAVIGMVMQVTGPTYASSTILAGVTMDRKITTIKFLSNTDTAGLGSKTADAPFSGQFSGKSVDDKFAVKDDVQAVSGATISSRGVATMLKLAGYKAGEYLASNFGGKAGSGAAPVIADIAPMEAGAALKDLFPDAAVEPLPEGAIANTVEESIVIDASWLVREGGKVTAVVVQARGQTYKASTALVGVKLDRTLAGIRIVATTDSKKYGYAMCDPAYYSKFSGKPVDDPFIAKSSAEGGVGSPDGDVDAISGATVSTMGLANIVKIAGYEGAQYLAKNAGGKKGAAGSEKITLNAIPVEE